MRFVEQEGSSLNSKQTSPNLLNGLDLFAVFDWYITLLRDDFLGHVFLNKFDERDLGVVEEEQDFESVDEECDFGSVEVEQDLQVVDPTLVVLDEDPALGVEVRKPDFGLDFLCASSDGDLLPSAWFLHAGTGKTSINPKKNWGVLTP